MHWGRFLLHIRKQKDRQEFVPLFSNKRKQKDRPLASPGGNPRGSLPGASLSPFLGDSGDAESPGSGGSPCHALPDCKKML
jgi:hypothetical protein